MKKMKFFRTGLEGAWLIVPPVFEDERGFFLESYSKEVFAKHGIDADFKQENHSRSLKKGTLRGLHFQKPPYTQAKLVRVSKGGVYDVIIDLRQNSETYCRYGLFELNDKNFNMLFVPKGFAHGFCVLEDDTDFLYKVDEYYEPKSESGIIWNDPAFKIQWWPFSAPFSAKDLIISDKDKKLPNFRDLKVKF